MGLDRSCRSRHFAVEIGRCIGTGVFVIYWNLLFISFLIALDGWFSWKGRRGVLVHELRLELGSVGRNEFGCLNNEEIDCVVCMSLVG